MKQQNQNAQDRRVRSGVQTFTFTVFFLLIGVGTTAAVLLLTPAPVRPRKREPVDTAVETSTDKPKAPDRGSAFPWPEVIGAFLVAFISVLGVMAISNPKMMRNIVDQAPKVREKMEQVAMGRISWPSVTKKEQEVQEEVPEIVMDERTRALLELRKSLPFGLSLKERFELAFLIVLAIIILIVGITFTVLGALGFPNRGGIPSPEPPIILIPGESGIAMCNRQAYDDDFPSSIRVCMTPVMNCKPRFDTNGSVLGQEPLLTGITLTTLAPEFPQLTDLLVTAPDNDPVRPPRSRAFIMEPSTPDSVAQRLYNTAREIYLLDSGTDDLLGYTERTTQAMTLHVVPYSTLVFDPTQDLIDNRTQSNGTVVFLPNNVWTGPKKDAFIDCDCFEAHPDSAILCDFS